MPIISSFKKFCWFEGQKIDHFTSIKAIDLKLYQTQMKLGVLHLLDTYMLPYELILGEIKGKILAFMTFVAFI